MYSGDIEKLISGFDNVTKACIGELEGLSSATRYQINTEGVHGEVEIAVPYTINYGSITGAASPMMTEIANTKTIGDTVYSGKNSLNTSSGSPFEEVERFKTTMEFVTSQPATVSFVGEKAAAMSDINMLLSTAIDAKHAVIKFHDSLTRGFDSEFHGNRPSIKWNKNVKGEKTIGNKEKQPKHNNVNIPPDPIDPY